MIVQFHKSERGYIVMTLTQFNNLDIQHQIRLFVKLAKHQNRILDAYSQIYYKQFRHTEYNGIFPVRPLDAGICREYDYLTGIHVFLVRLHGRMSGEEWLTDREIEERFI